MHYDVQRFIENCVRCMTLRPRVQKQNDTWPEADAWERVHIDWAYIKKQGNVLIVVDAGSGWIEAFPCSDRSSANVIKCLSATFSRFGIPYTLVSDNAKEFICDEVTNWLRHQGCRKIESPLYYPRANGLAERAVQTIKRAMNSWDPIMRVTFHAYLMKVLLAHRNTSNARSKTPSEILNGRKVRVPVIVDFPVGEEVIYKPSEHSAPIPAKYIVRKGNNTAWISRNDQTILASNNQIGRLPSPTETLNEEKRIAPDKQIDNSANSEHRPTPEIQTDAVEEPTSIPPMKECPAEPRRSSRAIKLHPKYNDYVMKC
jgi:hypothetical protein